MTNVEYYLNDLLAEENKFLKIIELADQNPCSCETLVEWLFDEHEE